MALGHKNNFEPAAIARASFPTTFRGYDQDAVRRYLGRLAEHLEDLPDVASFGSADADRGVTRRIRELEAEVESLTIELDELEAELDDNTSTERGRRPALSIAAEDLLDESRAIELLGEETARVLKSARSAAEDILKRAEHQAAQREAESEVIVADAKEKAAELVAQRQAHAEKLVAKVKADTEQKAEEITAKARQHRELAVAESNRILEDAEARAETIEAEAEKQARQVVADAERLREQILSELVADRHLAKQELDDLISSRDRLALSLAVARSELDAVTRSIDSVELGQRSSAGLSATGPRSEMDPRRIKAEVDELVIDLDSGSSDLDNTVDLSPERMKQRLDTAGNRRRSQVGSTANDNGRSSSNGNSGPNSRRSSSGSSNGRNGASGAAGVANGIGKPGSFIDLADAVDAAAGLLIGTDDGLVEGAEQFGASEMRKTEFQHDPQLGNPSVEDSRLDSSRSDSSVLDSSLLEGFDVLDETRGPKQGRVTDETGGGLIYDAVTAMPADDVVTTVTGRLRTNGARRHGDIIKDEPVVAAPPEVFAARDAAISRSGAQFRRQLRRALNDDQSDVLDRLRVAGSGVGIADLPPMESHLEFYAKPLRAGLVELVRAGEAQAGGHKAGSNVEHTLDNLVAQLAKYLVEELRVPTAALLEGSLSPEEIQDSVRALYRDFRNSELTDFCDDSINEAFAVGLFISLEDGTKVVWLTDPRTDPDPICQINAERGAIRHGDSFPSGDVKPLASPGSRCLVVSD